MHYAEFLESKTVQRVMTGIQEVPPLNPMLFPEQAAITALQLRWGRGAVFSGCGTGKTPIQLDWARVVSELIGPVLILAPLAVAQQTVREGVKFGIDVQYARSMPESLHGITITNYEMLHHFDPSKFAGIVLDESGILKAYDGKTRTAIINAFRDTQFKLACTATPAPNDFMELGNHAEFLGIMSRVEMLSMFFVHDGGETQKWRLKGHAEKDFWKWLASWSVMLRKPSDLGPEFDDSAYILPPLHMHEHIIRVDKPTEGYLFALQASTLQERIAARRESVQERCEMAANVIYNWQLCGNQNTQSEGGSNIDPTPQNANVANNKGARRKKTESICENITKTTSPGGSPTEKQGSPPSTLAKKSATRRMKHSAKNAKSAHETTAKHQPSVQPASNANSESQLSNGTNYSHDKMADVQFAVPVALTEEGGDSSSITAINREMCEDSCAAIAISESEDSKTIQLCLSKQSDISKTPWIIWCALNSEQDRLEKIFGDTAFSVRGANTSDEKTDLVLRWLAGERPIMISKVSCIGFGMNFQHCANIIFVGLSDSWEQFYQAVRRCWRYGQDKPVNVHIIIADNEGAVLQNIKDKDAAANVMADAMVEHMRTTMRANIHTGTVRHMNDYEREIIGGDHYAMHLGDCVEVVKDLAPDSIHYTIFSPPFASLYTYSASDRDMGNCKDQAEFMVHFQFLVKELYRVTMPGRLLSFHCMNLPTSKTHHGYIGIRDFRGDLIKLFENEGWIFHSEVCIWKDPVTAMQRTKALGLLYKQLKKDSAMSRQGIPDYLVTMRKPGDNPERVTKTEEGFPVGVWQNYASPVWMDINPSDTLQFRSVREHEDERHIAPLQLQVIQRAIELWTNLGDTVLSPFAGIGSEGYVALQNGRQFIGAELKRSYWTQACENLKQAKRVMGDLFDVA